MTRDEVGELFAYNDWANARLFDAAQSLELALWERNLGDAFPTLLALSLHLVGAEARWLMRWRGETPLAKPLWAEEPTPARLRAGLTEVEEERRRFLAGLRDQDLQAPVAFTLADGKGGSLALETLIRHAANHSTYHRGQFSSMLRRLGTTPPATDYLWYALERSVK